MAIDLLRGRFQLRGLKDNEDSGELKYCETLESAFEEFVKGSWWKLSWSTYDGKRYRLLKAGDELMWIVPTKWDNDTHRYEVIKNVVMDGKHQMF